MKVNFFVFVSIFILALNPQQASVAAPFAQDFEGFYSERNSPNVTMNIMPKAGTTMLSLHYTSSKASKYVLRICDENNEVIFSKDVELTKGKNTIDLVDVKTLHPNIYSVSLQRNDKVLFTCPFMML